jgi:hypothetical protein
MTGRLSSFNKRLDKVERQQAERNRRLVVAECNCREITIALPHQAKEFEAEINRTCTAHGVRRLGKLLAMSFVNPGMTVTDESAKLNQLLETYRFRLS